MSASKAVTARGGSRKVASETTVSDGVGRCVYETVRCDRAPYSKFYRRILITSSDIWIWVSCVSLVPSVSKCTGELAQNNHKCTLVKRIKIHHHRYIDRTKDARCMHNAGFICVSLVERGMDMMDPHSQPSSTTSYTTEGVALPATQ